MTSIKQRSGAVATAAAVAALLSSQSYAAQTPARFTLTMFENGIGAQSMQSGDYAKAISAISGAGLAHDFYSSIGNTNLCVAQAMSGKLVAARRACDDAVRDALEERAAARPWAVSTGTTKEHVAIAYANRAVVHWLGNNRGSAAADLAKAQHLAPKAPFVAQNLAALDAAQPQKLRLSESQ